MNNTSFPRGLSALPIIGAIAVIAVLAILIVSSNNTSQDDVQSDSQDTGRTVMLQENTNTDTMKQETESEINEGEEHGRYLTC